MSVSKWINVKTVRNGDEATQLLSVNNAAIETMLNGVPSDRPLCVVAIAGPIRVGKSTTLTRLVGKATQLARTGPSLDGQSGLFPVRHGETTFTSGADVPSELFSASALLGGAGASGTPNILLVDVEGGGQQGAEYDMRMFAVPLVISSVFILQVRDVGAASITGFLQAMVRVADQLQGGTAGGRATLGTLVVAVTGRNEYTCNNGGDEELRKQVMESHTEDASVAQARRSLKRSFKAIHFLPLPAPNNEALLTDQLGKLGAIVATAAKQPHGLFGQADMVMTPARLPAVAKKLVKAAQGPTFKVPVASVLDIMAGQDVDAAMTRLRLVLKGAASGKASKEGGAATGAGGVSGDVAAARAEVESAIGKLSKESDREARTAAMDHAVMASAASNTHEDPSTLDVVANVLSMTAGVLALFTRR